MRDLLLAPMGASALLMVLAKITLLLGLAVLGARMLRRATAGVRHLWWLVVLFATLLIPVLELTQPVRFAVIPAAVLPSTERARPASATHPVADIPQRVVERASGPVSVEIPHMADGSSAEHVVSIPRTEPSAAAALPTGARVFLATLSPFALLALVWFAGVLLTAAWLARSWFAARRIVRGATVVTASEWTTPLYEVADRIGLEDVPRLVQSSAVRMPFACGVRTPTIVLPVAAEAWSAERRQAVLLHELAHVRRRDLLGHTFARLVCAVYWFHPLVWMAAGALRSESEQACDDLAVSSGTKPSDYAEHLLDIVTSVKKDATPAVGIAMARRSEFEGRMLAILDTDRPRRGTTRRQATMLAGLIGAVTLLVGAAAPVAPDSRPVAFSREGTGASHAASEQDAVPSPAGHARDARRTSSDVAVSDVAVTGPVQGSVAHDGTGQIRNDNGPRVDIGPVGTPETRLDRETRALAQDVRASVDDVMSVPMGVPGGTPNGVPKRFSLEKGLDAIVSMGIRTGLASIGLLGNGRAASGLLDSMPVSERIRLLTHTLERDSSASTRRIAAWGLNEYQSLDGSVRRTLVAALRSDADASVREMAAWALGETMMGGTAATDALTDAVRRDASAHVRATAAWALGQLRVESARSALLQALDDRDANVRVRAAWALGTIVRDRVPREIVAHLDDEDRQVRRAVTWVLHEARDESAGSALQRALREEKDLSLRRDMFRTLVVLGETSTTFVREMLDDPDPQIRETAIALLTGHQPPNPWPWPWPEPRPYP